MLSQIEQPAIKSQLISHTDTKHTLTVEPLLPGFGYTLGNSLRRVMLSSVPGFAVTRVRINDITHEYQALEGVVEDALDVILNLKNLRAKIITDDEAATLELHKSTTGEVTAADFAKNAKVNIINEDLYICTLNEGVELKIEVTLERGAGYLSVDEINFGNSNPQEIVVDALFSAVSNVALNVDKVRVGENTNFDKITIDFTTDGTVEAAEVVNYTLSSVIEMLQKIQSGLAAAGSTEVLPAVSVVEQDIVAEEVSEDEEINLPKTILRILDKNEITTLSQLREREKEVADFPGITEAHVKKIKKLLAG